MALSQIQCLDDNNVNLRTNESKPEFFYSEYQRLALETLLDDGQERFEEYVKTNSIRPFLSELELAQLTRSVELYSPGSPDYIGDSDATELSLQYWPDRSDYTLPDLDIGWPTYTSYRGVTRVNVYAQPPLEGQTHIKEIVRKMIVQAQKVIAIVMDLFTDLDIFKDLLDASFKRKVAVYIMLESTGVPHFLKMCEKAAMHTGHLKGVFVLHDIPRKSVRNILFIVQGSHFHLCNSVPSNLRVRSIGGMEFLTRTSKKVCGSQSQRFMFVDGDKAVSGSYSFTWTASRIDRNIITVLSGQVVDAFDKLFQDLYVMSNAVNLHKLNLDTEPKPEPPPQIAPALLPSANLALKLINPKYALVSSSVTANSKYMPSEKDTAKIENCKQTKEGPEVPLIHPGLLHLEKVNMIHYLPLWPVPDPPNDVIGFINVRQYNKPSQAHLMHSEVSHAIRFKETFHSLKLPDRACARSTLEFLSPASVLVNEPQHQTIPVEKTTHGEPLEQMQLVPQNHNKESQQEAQNDVKDKTESLEAHDMEKHMDASAEQAEEIHALSQSTGEDIPACLSGEQRTDSKISANRPLYPETSPFSVECEPSSPSPKVTRVSSADTKATSVFQSCNKDTEPLTSKTAVRDHQRQRVKDLGPDTNETDVDYAKTPNHDSSSSSTSEEYFECSDSFPDDSGFEGVARGMQLSNGLSEQNQGLVGSNRTPTHRVSSLTLRLQQGADGTTTACSREQESSHEILKEKEEVQPQSGSQEQGKCQATTGMSIHKHSEPEATGAAPADRTNGPSDPGRKAHEQQTPEADAGADPSAEQGSESREHGVPWKAKTVTRIASDKAACQNVKVEKLPPEPYSVVNSMICFQSKETSESDKSHSPENRTHEVMHDKEPAPVEQAQPGSQAQSVAPDVVTEVQVKPELHSASTYTSDHRSAAVHDVKHHGVREEDGVLHMLFQSHQGAKRLHEENAKPPSDAWLTDAEKQLIVEDPDLQQAGYVSNSGPELKKNTVKQSCKADPPAQKPLAEVKASANTCSSIKKQPSSPGVFGKEEPVLEHISHEFKNQPEAKPEIKQNMRKLRQASPKPIQTPLEAWGGSFKASDTKLQGSSVPTKPVARMLGGPKLPHGERVVRSRAGERHSDAAPTRPCQAQLGHPGHARTIAALPRNSLGLRWTEAGLSN